MQPSELQEAGLGRDAVTLACEVLHSWPTCQQCLIADDATNFEVIKPTVQLTLMHAAGGAAGG